MKLHIRITEGIFDIDVSPDDSVDKLCSTVREQIQASEECSVHLIHKGLVVESSTGHLRDTPLRDQDSLVVLVFQPWEAPAPKLDDVVADSRTIMAHTKHYAAAQFKDDSVTASVPRKRVPKASPAQRESVAQLIELGFSEAAAAHALLLCRQNVEQAMNWLLDHPAEAAAVPDVSEAGHDAALVQQLVARGFTTEEIEAALGYNQVEEEPKDVAAELGAEHSSLQHLSEESPIVQCIRESPEIQAGLGDKRVLEALHSMIKDPSAAHRYLSDPQIGPVLMKVHQLILKHSNN